ncbi:MAG: YkgJ family cysteine cluster protein [Hyphomicrobium sp.]
MTETISPCTTCGACCSYSSEWPRFSTESDAAIERLPQSRVDLRANRMRCEGDRCSALLGTVGVVTACSVYADRPEVCRACEVGDDACTMARTRWGLPILMTREL